MYGGISSGKTSLCKKLSYISSVEYFSFDRYIQHLYATSSHIKRQMASYFGAEVIAKNCIDRVFLLKKLLQSLDNSAFQATIQIVKPNIVSKLKSLKNRYSKSIILVEAPLLVTYELQYLFDTLIYLNCPVDIRYGRFMKQSNSNIKYKVWRWIIDHQINETANYADIVISPYKGIRTDKTLSLLLATGNKQNICAAQQSSIVKTIKRSCG